LFRAPSRVLPHRERGRRWAVAKGRTARLQEDDVTATNEIEAFLCREDMPDEFSRLASSSPPSDHTSSLSLLSGLVPTKDEDGVMCPLMLRRHLIVPAIDTGPGAQRSLFY